MVTQLVAGGVDWRTVSGRAGHADGHMTLATYAHFQQAQDRQAAELMERLLAPADAWSRGEPMPARNSLRAALKEKRGAHARLAAELRKRSAGTPLPKTQSLTANISRWVNNHQQPDDFYRELLAQALGRPRAELFSDEGMRVEFPADAQPWRLARALEVASIGPVGVAALEHTPAELARSSPSTPPTALAGPVFEHLRDVVRLLEGPLPVERRHAL